MPKDRRQQILEVSHELFLHYGFQKVTLVDIAKEIGVSRPTVYQEFSNKEEIFKALLEGWREVSLSRIIEGRRTKDPVKKQLRDAIEIWVIEPYEMMSDSPKGEEFADCTYGFAKETLDASYVEFSKLIEIILKESKVRGKLSNRELANFIAVSLRGLKAQAKDLADLRRLISNLLALALS